MDWQIRIALIIVGIGVIAFIFYDYNRRKKVQAEKQSLIDQMRQGVDRVDPQGFDINGVTSARKASDVQQGAGSEKGVLTPEIESTGVEGNRVGGNRVEGNRVVTEAFSSQKTPASLESKAKSSPTEQLSLVAESDEKRLGKRDPGDMDPAEEPELVISLILRATQDAMYKGKDFMPLFLSQGLRHGDMDIFHRYSGSAGKPGVVSYSVANAIQPGTFEINNIENFETPAFAFFMALPGPNDPVTAFEGMVKTIKLLKQELGGQILDETKSVFTKQTHQHLLDSLKDYLAKASLR